MVIWAKSSISSQVGILHWPTILTDTEGIRHLERIHAIDHPWNYWASVVNPAFVNDGITYLSTQYPPAQWARPNKLLAANDFQWPAPSQQKPAMTTEFLVNIGRWLITRNISGSSWIHQLYKEWTTLSSSQKEAYGVRKVNSGHSVKALNKFPRRWLSTTSDSLAGIDQTIELYVFSIEYRRKQTTLAVGVQSWLLWRRIDLTAESHM